MIPMILAAGGGHDPKDHVIAHGLFRLSESNLRLPFFQNQASEFWFTNHLLMTLTAAALTLLIFVPVGRRYQAALVRGGVQAAPKGLSGLIEAFMDALRTAVVRPLLKEQTDRFMPLLWGLFFFILINNLLGMLPLGAIFGLAVGNQHIGGTATGNINVTAGLALVAFISIHVGGIGQIFRQLRDGTYGHHPHEEHEDGGHGHAAHGPDAHGHDDHGHGTRAHSPGAAFLLAPAIYLWNFAPHPFKPSADASPVVKLALWMVDLPMWAFLLVLEFIGAVVKPFALSIRLFANMAAGHIVIGSLLLLLPAYHGVEAGYVAGSLPIAIGCVLLNCLELFVAFLQAYIFMFLTSIFLSMAVYPEH
ncbi:MAG: hypothetical protein BroJett005_30980 [Ignavibacteriota bacterium]|nr:MAG: hypothetical protein BroJett005_30980 [Ignavibacteriota bacterium]